MSAFLQLPSLDGAAHQTEPVDSVYQYALEVLTLGILWHGFHDATKEGDGHRVLVYFYDCIPFSKSIQLCCNPPFTASIPLFKAEGCICTAAVGKVHQHSWSDRLQYPL